MASFKFFDGCEVREVDDGQPPRRERPRPTPFMTAEECERARGLIEEVRPVERVQQVLMPFVRIREGF